MVWLKRIINLIREIRSWLTWPYYRIMEERTYKKRMKELKAKDPFTYK